MARVLLVLGLMGLASSAALAQAASGYVPHRVFLGSRSQFVDFETFVADVARADVVLVGEQHDDVATHRLELALLEGLASRRSEIVLALEMFERDVQEPIDHFWMGHLTEAEFLGESRPWPHYRRDYKPLVDLAVARQWPVIAANLPRTLAADITRDGLETLADRSEAERRHFARDWSCPTGDRYFERFSRLMRGHADAGGASEILRYYLAQCLKDETMAESIAASYRVGAAGGKRPLVVAISGAFHVEYSDGLTARTRRRLPDKRVVTVSFLPVDSLDGLEPDDDVQDRADYVVYTM
jgi:uncharacterized iron-regulated protein